MQAEIAQGKVGVRTDVKSIGDKASGEIPVAIVAIGIRNDRGVLSGQAEACRICNGVIPAEDEAFFVEYLGGNSRRGRKKNGTNGGSPNQCLEAATEIPRKVGIKEQIYAIS
jgi:hypothetical protein